MKSSTDFGPRTRFEDPCGEAVDLLMDLLPRVDDPPTAFINCLAAWRSGHSLVLIGGCGNVGSLTLLLALAEGPRLTDCPLTTRVLVTAEERSLWYASGQLHLLLTPRTSGNQPT